VNTIGFLRVDSKATIGMMRNGKNINATVTLSDPKKRQELISKNDPFFYGVGLKNFSLQSPLHGNIRGIMVVSVDPDTTAFHADLRPGDVIVSVNQQPVTNIAELKQMLAKANKSLLLNILRGPGALFLVINKE
jgi:serine protease Do